MVNKTNMLLESKDCYSRMNYDIIIIGAGCAGLSLGALLSNRDYRVLLLEKDKIIGGRAKVIEKGGFVLDYGIHINRFAKQSALAKVLKNLGKEVEFHSFSPPLVYVPEDKKFYLFPNTPSSFFKIFFTTKFLSLKEKLKFINLFLRVPTLSPKKYHFSSVYDTLKRFNLTEGMVDVIRLFCGVTLICPELTKVSAVEVGNFLRKAIFVRKHVGYVKGGWETIFKILTDEITRKGKILTDMKVKEIKIKDNKVEKVITDNGDEYKAKCYVVTLPFQHLPQILNLEKLSNELKEYVKRVEPTSGINLDFGLNKKISNINSIIMTAKPLLSIGCFISNIEEKLAPNGYQLGNWFCFIPHNRIKDEEYVKEQLKLLKGLLNEMFPNIWGNVIFERVLVLDIVDGAAPCVGQTFTDRPQFKSNIENLFFAGDTTGGFGWGSEIAFDSAIKCSKLIEDYLTQFT